LITPDEQGYYCLARELPPETMRELAALSAVAPLKGSAEQLMISVPATRSTEPRFWGT
jgi:hypothetical protein